MITPELRIEPVAELENAIERRCPRPQHRQRIGKVPAVGIQIPVATEAAQSLNRRKIHQLGLENLIRRIRAIDHAPGGVVAHDRRAAQALEDADLNLLWAQGDEPIESAPEAGEVFTRKA